MVVTVDPRHGSNVPVINRDDVIVYQGHDRAQVADWLPLQGEHAGLQLFILIDDAANTSLGSQLEDIRQFINAHLPPRRSVWRICETAPRTSYRISPATMRRRAKCCGFPWE